MARYTAITIIYNPNSTGSSHRDAKALAAKLNQKIKAYTVAVVPTERPGHGRELAEQLAHASARPLIISASGDGGYHDVINGIMQANHDGAHAVAGLLPSGNANDHYSHVHKVDMVDLIVGGKHDTIDVLSVKAKHDGASWQAYAHSYAGIGFTPHAATKLNQTSLNRRAEAIITARSIFGVKPVTIIVKGKHQTYSNLVFSNVKRMAKIVQLSDLASVHDGKFEISAIKGRRKIWLIGSLFRSVINKPPSIRQAAQYRFRTTKPLQLQLDGELYKADADSVVTITIAARALPCIV